MPGFKARLERFQKSTHFISVPHEETEQWTNLGVKRVLANLKSDFGTLSVHSALTRQKDQGLIIHLGLPACKTLKIKEGDWLTVDLEEDTSPYQFNMPEELQAVLDTLPEANMAFQLLSPGKQRSILHLISTLKSEQKRIEKALTIADRLRMGIIDLKELSR